MKPGWLIGILVLFVGLQIYMGVCEMSYTNEIPAVFGGFLVGGDWSASSINDMLNGLWSALIFDYPFFVGSWAMLRYVFLSVSAGVVIIMLWSQPMATLITGGVLGLATLVSGWLS